VRAELLPGAVADAQQAFAWYRERDDAAANGFIAELEAAFEAIEDAPDRWPSWLHRTHRYLLRRYPYFVVYRVQDTAIWIVAVAHARQAPGYWTRR
jgi:toxin ParE1/3/4